MFEEIWQKNKIPCAFNFGQHSVDQIDKYIIIDAVCQECRAVLHVECLNKPSLNEDVIFQVSITEGLKDTVHKKKRRLTGDRRNEVKLKLRNLKPKQYRQCIASTQMAHGDPEPPTLSNLTSLRKARQEANDDKLGIDKGGTVFDSLGSMKLVVNYRKFIKNIGFDKFHIIYFSPEQIALHNDISNYLNNLMALDATGSVVLKIDRHDNKVCDILLSVLSTYIDNTIVPVCQMIFEKNDTNFYLYFLNTWLKSGAKVPSFVNTDMGRAIQNSVCLSFNNMSFTSYLDQCLLILMNEKPNFQINT